MIRADIFRNVLDTAIQYTPIDSTRPQFENVFLEFRSGNILRVVATTGGVMISIEMSVAHGQPDGMTFPLRDSDAQNLVDALRGRVDELLIYVVGEEIMFMCGADMYTYAASILSADDVPNFDKVLDAMPDKCIGAGRFDAMQIASAITRCTKFMDDDYPSVRLRIADCSPLYIILEVVNPAVCGITVVIMYKGGM